MISLQLQLMLEVMEFSHLLLQLPKSAALKESQTRSLVNYITFVAYKI
nr:hypothetical protein Iba_chr13bCG2770 [Ipomoea batatas]